MKNKIVFLFITFACLLSESREIALTFDDCPRKAGPVLDPMDRDKKLVSALKDAGIQAAFFCNSPSREINGLQRLKYFTDNGHLIANHSADHPDLYKISPQEFNKNIDQAHAVLNTLPGFRKWFRFPFLHEGKSSKDVEAVRSHLKQTGYTNGYVTIDTEDWYVDEVLRQKVAAGKKYDQLKLCQAYSRMLTDNGSLFDEMAAKALGRSVKHVILLHETDLNALCLSTVIQAFKKEGWVFVSPDEAYRDPLSKQEPKSSSKLNNGRVFALAKEAGYKGPYFTRWIEETEIEKELENQKVWK